MTNQDEAAVIYDCFLRALALPVIYSEQTVALLIEKLRDICPETTQEMAMIDAYIVFLRESTR